MAVFRIEKTKNYTVMSNYHLRDQNLSCKACGLLSKMLSLPEEWDYTSKGLARICKDGIDSVNSALRELEAHGYLVRRRLRAKNGQLGDIEYTIYERPQVVPETEKPVVENPILVNPVLEEPVLGNPAQLNTKESSTDGTKTDPSIFPEDLWSLYRERIAENIDRDHLADQYGFDRVDEVLELILETVLAVGTSIRIGEAIYPQKVVRERFLNLGSTHLEYVFDCMDKQTGRIHNIKSYLLAALFNAPTTIDNYYQAEVNHDLRSDF